MAVIRDLMGHFSVTLTEKYYAHLSPASLARAVDVHGEVLPNLLPNDRIDRKTDSEEEVQEGMLTPLYSGCYVPEVPQAGVAELADAPDSKSGEG